MRKEKERLSGKMKDKGGGGRHETEIRKEYRSDHRPGLRDERLGKIV